MTSGKPSEPTTSRFWSALKPTLLLAGLFSFFVNLMLLAPILYMLQVFDRVLASRSEETLVMLSIAAAIALLGMGLVDHARGRLLLAGGRRIDEMLGERVLKNLIRNASSVGRAGYVHGLKDVATLRGFFSGNNIIAMFDAPWLVFFILLIFLFHPWLGATALIGSLLLLALAWTNEKMNRGDLEQYQESGRRNGQMMDQGIRNADVLNSMGMSSVFAARWGRANAESLDHMQLASANMGAIHTTSKLLRQAIQVTMMGLGVYLVIDHQMTPGVMMAATILLGRAMAPVESLIGNWNGLVAARSAYGRLEKLFPEIFLDRQRTPLPPPKGEIRIEKVYLAGRTPNTPIIRQAELELPAGKSLGILGPSGSGKSSLARLMVGVWRPTSGHVRIDGADMDQWDPDFLGKHMGYLPQDVELFAGTVAENIARFSSPDDAAVLEAARRAHAYELVLGLPDGFDTRLGDGGIQLSAGQAQRVGRARALYGKPSIVVLDEPNANLDADGERALLRTLETLKQEGATVVMITHKPSLVPTMDYLLVMREGRIELMGPRDQVLARMGMGPQAAPQAVAA
jgi:PrtD family type I secretion system ABC transporter